MDESLKNELRLIVREEINGFKEDMSSLKKDVSLLKMNMESFRSEVRDNQKRILEAIDKNS